MEESILAGTMTQAFERYRKIPIVRIVEFDGSC
jgi:hypothetical protein